VYRSMAGSGIPYALETALGSIVEELEFYGLGKRPVWLLGGSCGLLLHGVQLSTLPRDIDIYCDPEDTWQLHQSLLRYAVSPPEEDFSGSCYSLRGLYFIGEAKVELVGGFRIGSGELQYSVDVGTLQQHAPVCNHEGIGLVRLMPAVHELIFNLLRGRDERCRAIADLIKQDLPVHLPLLYQLIQENHLEEHLRAKLEALLGISSSIQI
jgi:hypothetical protein